MNQKTFQYDPKGHSKHLYHSRHRIMNWVHGAHIREALKHADLDKGKSILDAGCSDGELLIRANGNYSFAVGADHNPQSLQTLLGRMNSDSTPLCLQSDIRNLPFQQESFDVVCCLETLEHVDGEQQAIKELKRVLKKEGTLIVSVPIELGLSILLKQGVSTLCFGGYRGSYSWGELWNATIGNLDEIERPGFSQHKGYDYRQTLAFIKEEFSHVQCVGLPFRWFGAYFNTQFMMVAKEKI